jgi:cell division protein FtsB
MLAKKTKKRKIAKKQPKAKFPKMLATIFVLLAVYLAYTNVMIFIERTRIGSDYTKLSMTYDELQEEKDLLKMRLGETYTDEYLEKVAREELGLYKEGEKVIVIKKGEEEVVEEEDNSQKRGGNFFEQVLNTIKEAFGLKKE